MSAISNKAISDYLGGKGIPHSQVAYRYLMLALRAMVDGKVDRYHAQSVYDYVARNVGVRPEQIDRAIRYAIRKTETPVMNKEFLARALNDLLLAADENSSVF